MEELKSNTTTPGEESVMITGLSVILRWFANSWTVVQHWRPLNYLAMVKEMEKSGMGMLSVLEMKAL